MDEPEVNFSETIQQVTSVLIRRRWWVLVSTAVVGLCTFGVLWRLPNRYTSEATLLVVQQQVPQRYVVPTSTTTLSETLEVMTQEVLSRTRLLVIIQKFGLYRQHELRLAPEELVDKMRKDITIQAFDGNPERRDANAFKISFVSDDPLVAQQVTSELTSLFIEQNLNSREHQATLTTNFLQEQLDDAKRKLTGAEERLRQFKMENLGELPEQQQGNVAILAGLNTELQNTMGAIDRAQQQRVYLESLLSGLRGAEKRKPAPAPERNANSGANTDEPKEGDLQRQGVLLRLARLRAEKAALLRVRQPDDPEVFKVAQQISLAEAFLQSLNSKIPAKEVADSGPEDSPAVAQLKSQLEANRVEVANLTKDAAAVKAEMAKYQNRLNQTPLREQQLSGILRDYDLLKQDYADLLSKQMQSQLAANLEKQQAGQQFRLVDAPILPTLPSSPNRIKIGLGGLAGGLVLGIGLAFVVDLKSHAYHTEKQLSRRFDLPLVIAVPLLRTDAEQRSFKKVRVLEWIAGSALMLIVLAAELYQFYLYRHG
jgi:polysaccharide chain length determinant protein (PEP-CTERM system associated)